MVKFLMMVISALLICLTIGCGDRAAQVEQNSSTSQSGANDGTGGGTTDADGVVINVDYTQFVDEDNVGLPPEPANVARYTAIKLALEVPYQAIKQKTTAKEHPDSFTPGIHRSYKISDDKLNVTLSDNTSLPLVLYLFPFKYESALQFAVFATLDNISYNILRLNQSHTAFYIKASRYPKTNKFVTAPVWNASKLDVTKYNKRPALWHGGRLALMKTGEVRSYPATTEQACFQNFITCAKLDTNKEVLLFQPIASVGYLNYDWFEYKFTDDKLAGYKAYGTKKPSDELMQLANRDTLKILKADKMNMDKDDLKPNIVQKSDIGWLGLQEAKRNKIIRFHVVSLQIKMTILEHTADSKTAIVLPKDSIELIDYTVGQDKQTKPKSVGNEKKSIPFISDE
jgi:hypothetical protein